MRQIIKNLRPNRLTPLALEQIIKNLRPNRLTPLALEIMSEKRWNKISAQRSIDKIEREIGIPVKDCTCEKCTKPRLVVNQLIALAFDFGIDELEVEQELKSHEEQND